MYAVYVNDTVIVEGYGHNWRIYQEPSPVPTDKRKKGYKFNMFSWIFKENR